MDKEISFQNQTKAIKAFIDSGFEIHEVSYDAFDNQVIIETIKYGSSQTWLFNFIEKDNERIVLDDVIDPTIMTDMVEKYYNERGEVAVLYSSDIGIGWSTGNYLNYSEFLLYDKTLVEMKLAGGTITELLEYLESVGDMDLSISGEQWNDLKIQWVDPNIRFRIESNFGHEKIIVNNDIGELYDIKQ